MSWIKIIFINVLITFLFVYFIEGLVYTGRYFLDKKAILPFSSLFNNVDDNITDCDKYKTDVLLGHVNVIGCKIRGGTVFGEYIVYGKTDTGIREKLKNNDYILILGGSTTSGFFQKLSDGYVWPLLLQKEVPKYTVINGGVGGYTSLQEFYKFSRDGARFKNLKLIISLNGINEKLSYQGEESYRSIHYPFLSETQFLINENQVWIDQRRIDKFTFLNLSQMTIPNIYSLITYNNQIIDDNITNSPNISWWKWRRVFTNNKLVQYDFFKSVSNVDRWENNITRLYEISKLLGAKYVVFLQPTMGLNGIQSKAPEGTNDFKLLENISESYKYKINDLYKDLRVRCLKYSYCFDISNIAPPLGDYYHDPRHHNAKGNKIIAKEILNILNLNELL